MTNKSIIRKQSVDITYDGVIDPFVFRDEVSWMCTTRLIPAIDRLFSQYAGDKIICFEELTIELGELSLENWQSVVVERVIEELSCQLGSTSMSFEQRWTSGTMSTGLAQSAGMKALSNEASARQCLLYFLENGTLPWNTSVKSRSELNKLLLDIIADPGGRRKLIQKLQTDHALIKRLISQFDDDILEQLIAQHTGISKVTFTGLTSFISKALQDKQTTANGTRERYYFLLIENLGADQTTVKFVADVIGAAIRQPEFIVRVRDLAQKGLSHVQIMDAMLEESVVKSEKEVDSLAHEENIRTQVEAFIENILSDKNADLNQMDQAQADKFLLGNRDQKTNRKSSLGPVQPGEEWFISNAGLVILHPFLPMLFENVGYTEDKKWITDETRYRAMTLMQYMLKGEGEYPEFEMTLNKILTGYPLDETLPADLILSDFEKLEANDVLASVIKHWTVLKNTSMDGLRSEFLQRDGKLFIEQGAWNLKVQQKTSDILMNRLPWGISMIKTPWMKTMMQVEWA
jgi:hypothetical protein